MSLSRRDFSRSLAAAALAVGGCAGLSDCCSRLQTKPLRAAIAGALRATPAR